MHIYFTFILHTVIVSVENRTVIVIIVVRNVFFVLSEVGELRVSPASDST